MLQFRCVKAEGVQAKSVVVSRSCEQRHLCHFVTNGEFLDVCAQSRKRCLSASVREPCKPTRLGSQGRLQDPSHLAPTKSPTGRSTQNIAVNAQKSLLSPSHTPTHSSQQPKICRRRHDSQHQTHLTGPTSALIAHYVPCLVSRDRGPMSLFFAGEFMGRRREAATMHTKISSAIAR